MSVKPLATWVGIALMLLTGRVSSGAEPLLADAAEHQDLAKGRKLIAQKASVTAPTAAVPGLQAEGKAARPGPEHHDVVEAVRLLLAAGANAKGTNRYGVTPLS